MSIEQSVSHVHFFMPIYFDVATFTILRERVVAQLPARYLPHFHLLDDSAGRDPEVASLRSLADITIVTMPYNLGHQRALVHGLRQFVLEAEGESLIVTMDGDGEDRPEDLPRLLEAFERTNQKLAIVLAKRTKREESLVFKAFYFFYKNAFRALTGTTIQTGNYAVFQTSFAKKSLFHPYFDLAYASTLFALGTQLVLVPCPRGHRYQGHSKMNFSRLAIHGVRMLMPFVDRIAIRSCLAFAAVSCSALLASVGLALAHGLGLLVIPPWLLGAALLSFVLSFLAICNFAILLTVYINLQGLAFSRMSLESPSNGK